MTRTVNEDRGTMNNLAEVRIMLENWQKWWNNDTALPMLKIDSNVDDEGNVVSYAVTISRAEEHE